MNRNNIKPHSHSRLNSSLDTNGYYKPYTLPYSIYLFINLRNVKEVYSANCPLPYTKRVPLSNHSDMDTVNFRFYKGPKGYTHFSKELELKSEISVKKDQIHQDIMLTIFIGESGIMETTFCREDGSFMNIHEIK